MKKTLTILLCLALLLALCACGSKKEEETGSGSLLGHLQHEGRETRYQNAELGVTCVLHDANWSVASEEYLAQEMGLTTQGKTAEEYAAELDEADSYCDLFADREDGNARIIVYLVKLDEDPDDFFTEAAMADLALPGLEKEMRESELTDVRCERNTALFCGAEREGVFGQADREGTGVYCQVLIVKAGDRMAMIYLISFENDETKALASFFKPMS